MLSLWFMLLNIGPEVCSCMQHIAFVFLFVVILVPTGHQLHLRFSLLCCMVTDACCPLNPDQASCLRCVPQHGTYHKASQRAAVVAVVKGLMADMLLRMLCV